MSHAPALSASELGEYLVDIGGTLLSYGCPTHRLEEVIRLIAGLEGYTADAFAVPTGLWMSLQTPGETPVVRMVRVKDWEVDLARLCDVDRIFNDVLARKLTLAEARRRLDEIERKRDLYPPQLRWLASAMAAAAAAVFIRGGVREVLIAALGGALIGLMRTFLSPRARLLQDFVGGLIAGALAWFATTMALGVSREVVVLSVVILLVPGMALTVGLSELAYKNLVSGASRLMEAFMVFLSILVGIAGVLALEQMLGLTPANVPRSDGFPWIVQLATVFVGALGFCVIFKVPRRFLPFGIVSGAIAWVATDLGARHLPLALSAFLASLLVNLYANLAARVTERPSQTFLLPGLVLLVPGSFGFLSLEAMLRGEVLGGAAKAFEMFMIAGAIVIGILVATVVLPARKLL